MDQSVRLFGLSSVDDTAGIHTWRKRG